MKKIFSLLVAVGILMPTAAFAAVNLQDFGFKVNGNTSDTIRPGEDFEITVNADVNDGDEVEYMRVRLKDTSNNVVSTDCQAVGRVRDVNDRDIKFNTETPSDIPNGQFAIELLPFGIPGEAQSNGCDLDHDIPGSLASYTGRLFIDDEGDISGNPSNGGSNSSSEDMTWNGIKVPAWVYALIQSMKPATPTTTPAVIKNECVQLQTKTTGTQYGVYNDANISLQGFLLSDNPLSIPALKAGSTVPMGFYGPQTQNAVSAFKVKYGCQ